MILSICIPSYNRFGELEKNITSILNAKSNDFEVVIVDNCSTLNKKTEFEKRDSRIRFCRLENPVDGKYNLNSCCKYGRGVFSLLCLDKDFVDGNKLDKFINFLSKNKSICGGYCLQNKEDDDENYICSANNSIVEFGYLGRHPSGYFYKTNLLVEALELMTVEELYNPFCPDLLSAICAKHGEMAMYKSSLIFLETPQKSSITKTYSYKNEKDLYFMPINRINQFEFYCLHAKQQKIYGNEFNRLFTRMYKQTLDRATFGFIDFMNNKEWCEHYNIKIRKVSINEVRKFKNYLICCGYKYCDNLLMKMVLLAFSNIYFYLKMLKRELGRRN